LEPQPKKEMLLDASKGMKNPSAFDGVQKVFGTVCALLRRPLGYHRYSKSRLSPSKVYSFLFFSIALHIFPCCLHVHCVKKHGKHGAW
jgi:hypothetical protein